MVFLITCEVSNEEMECVKHTVSLKLAAMLIQIENARNFLAVSERTRLNYLPT